MKNSFFILSLLVSSSVFAQQDTSAIEIPMKNGIVFFEKDYALNFKGRKEQQAVKALQWFGRAYSEKQDALKVADVKAGKISGTGSFKVVVSDSGNYFWVEEQVEITVSDSGYRFQAFDFYEKPIEKGVSNEFSKIEYRWRDFRKGKPWSREDRKLFEGIRDQLQSSMKSLEAIMSK